MALDNFDSSLYLQTGNEPDATDGWTYEETTYWDRLSSKQQSSLQTAAVALGRTVKELLVQRRDINTPSAQLAGVALTDLEVGRHKQLYNTLTYCRLFLTPYHLLRMSSPLVVSRVAPLPLSGIKVCDCEHH
jgi:hypothetical protein